jgi:hypothetical protein
MRRRVCVLLPCALLLVILSAAQAMMLAQAEPSPSPSGSVRVDTRHLGSGPLSATGERIGLIRLTFWPGATLGQQSDPGASVLYVESGRLGYRLVEGQAWVTRAPTGMGPVTAAPSTEGLAPGDVILRAGDSLFAEADAVYAAWNTGDAPALVTIATLSWPDQPLPPSI